MGNGDTSGVRPRAPIQVSSLVNKILKMSPSVRVATICDMHGKLVFTARRKSVKNLLSHTESRNSLRISAKNMAARRALSRKLGKCKYTLAEYDRIKRLVVPTGRNHIMFVTCSTTFDHMKIVRKVRTFR